MRLNVANTAKDVLEKVLAAGSGKLTVNGKDVTSRVVEGEEETQFWKEANEKRAAHRTQKSDRFSAGKRGKRARRPGQNGQKRKRNQGELWTVFRRDIRLDLFVGQDNDNDDGSNGDDGPSTVAKSSKKVKGEADD